MKLVTPEFGLIFWMALTFLTVMFLLAKFAWKPILKMISEREQSIEEALLSAEKAKKDIAQMQSTNEQLIKEAQMERDLILKTARDAKTQLINEAKTRANEEADRMIALAREAIRNERMAAVTDLKNQVAQLSLEVAEKIVKQQLSSDERQKELVNKLISEVKLN